MPDENLQALARQLRVRAEKVLARAETFQDARARQAMLEIAARYEKLAQRLEKETSDPDNA